MTGGRTGSLTEWAKALKRELAALAIATRDPRTPLAVKLLAAFVVAYALSPVDLVPDFIPVLGQLDDLILVPAGLWLVVRLLPTDVLAEARAKTAQAAPLARSKAGAFIIASLWIAGAAAAAWLTLTKM